MKKTFFSSFFLHFFLLVLALFLMEFSSLDFWLQDFFYHQESHQWIIDAHEPFKRAIFYLGLKWGIAFFGFLCVIKLVFYFTKNKKINFDLLQIILSLILVPLFVSFLKKSTHLHCPDELIQYGGSNTFINLWEKLQNITGTGKCFPAGHASAGFALLSLAYLRNFPHRWGLVIGLSCGWVMGLYQMLKGDHFLSHTLVTQQIAFLFNIIIAKMIIKFQTSHLPSIHHK